LVAPNDFRRVFALDASTGKVLWATPSEIDDVRHLMGVVNNRLIASGNRLYSISVEDGKIHWYWPHSSEKQGWARGIVADNKVYWPCRPECIRVFDVESGRQIEEPIDLIALGGRTGNLLAARGHLLSVTPEALYVLSPRLATGGSSVADLRDYSERRRAALVRHD
jgi:outer membrane protein assembly factor BamB